MATKDEPPSAAEFASWLRPGEARDMLPAEWDASRKERIILRRLAEGDIVACAARALFATGDSPGQRREMALIGAHLWSHPWRVSHRDLWTAGEVYFDDEPPPQAVFVFSNSG